MAESTSSLQNLQPDPEHLRDNREPSSANSYPPEMVRQIDLLSGHPVPGALNKRKSYTQEDKLRVLVFYKENHNNLYRMGQSFTSTQKNLLWWLKDKKKIRESKRGAR